MDVTGRVTYANGAAACGVRVRVFDKDAPGKEDDDLTMVAGISDEQGRFTVQFDPARFLDFANIPFLGLGVNVPDITDVFLPYLLFEYTFDGQPVRHTAPLVPFQSEYALPQSPALNFLPSLNGFKFPNRFPGYPLPFSVPFMPDGAKVSAVYGLCGGMSSAASDFFLAGRAVPETTEIPRRGTKFHRYLYRRAIDTFALGRSIARFAEWMALPDDSPQGVQRRTWETFEEIRKQLDDHRLVVLGLVYDRGTVLRDVVQRLWNNHQVLAYGCATRPDGAVDIRVYDPNYPAADDIVIRVEPVDLGQGVRGLRSMQKRGEHDLRPVRGFFAMPYEPIEPPEKL